MPSRSPITNISDLFDKLKLKQKKALSDAELAITKFPLRVTDSFLQRMHHSCLSDPLLKQILPTKQELYDAPGYTRDPLAETNYQPVPGLLHKYKGRALLLLTEKCALNCRFCFRRNYSHNKPLDQKDLSKIIDYLDKHPNISEVILSGGDPLTITDKKLSLILRQLAKIKHLKNFRIHTRMPIADPKRITRPLTRILIATRLQPIMVLHCNHAREINSEVRSAIKLLQSANILIFNQSVLLKGVNDSAKTLIELSNTLGAIGVIPYYLHLLDKASGTSHFAVDIKKARALHQAMRCSLPGYLVPRLARDMPGQKTKIWC